MIDLYRPLYSFCRSIPNYYNLQLSEEALIFPYLVTWHVGVDSGDCQIHASRPSHAEHLLHQHGTKNRCHGNGQKIDRLSADSDEVEEDGRAATTPYSISFAAWHSLLGAILTVNDNIRRPEKDDVLAGKAA